jgi:hypothetical protein
MTLWLWWKRYKNEKLTDLMLTINLYIGIIFGRLIYLEYVFHAMISKFIGYNQVCNTDTGEPLFGVDLNFVLLDQWSVIRVRTPLEISFILSFCGLSLGARHFRLLDSIFSTLQSCHCLSLKYLNLFKYCM